MSLSKREMNRALKIKKMSEQWPVLEVGLPFAGQLILKIKKMSEQWSVTMDQKVLHAIQEQVKVLETASQSHSSVFHIFLTVGRTKQ